MNTRSMHLPHPLARLWRTRPAPGRSPEARATGTSYPRAGVFDRIDAWFWRRHQQDIEAWLAKAHDRADLEHRLEALEHGQGPRLD